MNCTLCKSPSKYFAKYLGHEYFRCSRCKSIMMNPNDYLDSEDEKSRYEEHNNDVEDPRYQEFVSPIVDRVLKDYKPQNKGLDFGSGTGPVITKLLRDKGYNIKLFDPFFAYNPRVLEEKYDYIVSCEVIEHFHNPRKEFELLRSLLKPGGSIYIMTSPYKDTIDFNTWGYKNDLTHVFFYHQEALEWIKKEFAFSKLEVHGKLIVYNL